MERCAPRQATLPEYWRQRALIWRDSIRALAVDVHDALFEPPFAICPDRCVRIADVHDALIVDAVPDVPMNRHAIGFSLCKVSAELHRLIAYEVEGRSVLGCVPGDDSGCDVRAAGTVAIRMGLLRFRPP